MQTILSILGYGFLVLLAAAVLVAALEHVLRQGRAKAPYAPEAPKRAAHLDVDLGNLDSEQGRRQVAVDSALSRLSRPGTAAAGPGPWPETRPMVSAGTPTEAETH
jgi:hypothetical protein